MKDLANERAAVEQELRRMNFEPVNAEGILPTGGNSWGVIESELADCDLFVLILGETYGWVPESGPHVGEGRSVTELEYVKALDLGLQILPFLKRLGYDADRNTADAAARDAFRERVEDWDTGHYRAEFDLALDLAPKVSRAISGLLTQRMRDQHAGGLASTGSISSTTAFPVVSRGTASYADPRPRNAGSAAQSLGEATRTAVELPAELVGAVRDRSAVLFAGAGMSIESGLPSAYAFTQHLLTRISEIDAAYARGVHGGDFNDVATDLARLVGRDGLYSTIDELMKVESIVGPSPAQLAAVEAFDLVVTTNYDTLLERADTGSRLRVVAGELVDQPLPQSSLVKLHGTIGDPATLVVTAEDISSHSHRRRHVLALVREQFASRPVVVVGSSLRDPTTTELFAGREGAPTGWYVSPVVGSVDKYRLREMNLEPVVAVADTFFAALAASLLRPA